MKTSAELRRELAEAERREKRAKEVCTACDGKGYICDTTYDRTGEDTICGRCHGTGLPHDRVESLIFEALGPYRKWPRRPSPKGE